MLLQRHQERTLPTGPTTCDISPVLMALEICPSGVAGARLVVRNLALLRFLHVNVRRYTSIAVIEDGSCFPTVL
jgi:hypothetical protein